MSKKAILIESRSIKKLLQKVNDNEVKRTILRYFLKLLKKYDVPAIEEQSENSSGQYDRAFPLGKSDDKYVGKQFADVESFLGLTRGDAQTAVATRPQISQCVLIEDIRKYLRSLRDDYFAISDEEVVAPLVVFLTTALEKHDIEAVRAGCQLFFAFLGSRRDEILCLSEDAYTVLASLLETDVTEDVLAIMEVLSHEVSSGPKIAASGALCTLIGFLDKDNRKIQKLVLQILRNLSLSDVLCLHPECIPKLTPFLSDISFAGLSIVILRNLCDKGDAWVTIAETKGSFAAIVGLLDTGSSEDQEHAVFILLCAHRVEYCRLVMDEVVISNLVHILVNGNERAKTYAGELLRLLGN